MVGFGGVALLPAAAPWLWGGVAGVCVGLLFPIALMLPLDVESDPRAVRQLTAMALSVGYLLAAPGPLLLGWLRGASGGFALPFLVLAALCAAALVEAYRLRPEGGRASAD